MFIMWRVRWFDRNTKTYNDRDLVLDTSTLDTDARIEVEVAVETRSSTDRDVLRFRALFRAEQDGEWLRVTRNNPEAMQMVFVPDYFEDEEGKEITITEIGRIVTGDPDAMFFPYPVEQHYIDFMRAKPQRPPVDSVVLTQENLNLLGYFARELAELERSSLYREGAGKMSQLGKSTPLHKTAVTEEEIGAFVTIFRRLYMDREPANFAKIADLFVKTLQGHPYANWMLGAKQSYERKLGEVPELVPIIQQGQISFSRKRLFDVFIYTQYAHQPNRASGQDREQQFNDCLSQVNGDRGVLNWFFLNEIRHCAMEIVCAGKVIRGWLDRYCTHHKAIPQVIGSMVDGSPGIGSIEKAADRRARLISEKRAQYRGQSGMPDGGS